MPALKHAKSTGFCDKLEKTTTKNLINPGYPKEAFEITYMSTPDITFCNKKGRTR